MRRTVILLLIITLVATVLSNCGNNTYNVLIVDSEYVFADTDSFEGVVRESTKLLTVSNKQETFEFVSVEYNGCNYFPEYVYRNKSNHLETAHFDPNGIMVRTNEAGLGKQAHTTSEDNVLLSLDELKNIAKEKFEEIMNPEDISQYRIVVVSPAVDYWSQYFLVSFAKYVDGIKTADEVIVRIMGNGRIHSINATMFGRVPADTENPFELEKAKTAVYERLDNYYADKKDDYDEISYGEPDFRLTVLKDGKTALACSVAVRLRKDIEGEKDPQYISDLMHLVVTAD